MVFPAAALVVLSVPGNASAFGDENCGEGIACLLGCDKNDAQCSFDCGQSMHAQAAKLFAELQLCLLPVCPGNPPDPVCILQAGLGACAPEYQACLADAGCIPSCGGKDCGDDGCAGSCGTCPPGLVCNNEFHCSECQPNCSGKDCGDDGCGGSCGGCGGGQGCVDFHCQDCTPQCDGKDCGDDGCGGVCGQCGFTADCIAGKCISCTPDCAGKECGDNGCGGMCGACGQGWKCNDSGVCIEDIPCVPDCLNRECGDDGCEGECGACGLGQYCNKGGICVDGAAPDVTEEEDSGGGSADVTTEDAPGTGGQDKTGPVTNGCPPGYKYYFGQCLPAESAEEGSDDGGCSSSPRATSSPGPAWLLLLAGLLLIPWTARMAARRKAVLDHRARTLPGFSTGFRSEQQHG
jgi:hypothetical protein